MPALRERFGVQSIGFLKLDVEGQEENIINGLAAAAAANPSLWPRGVLWEQKKMNKPTRARLAELMKANR